MRILVMDTDTASRRRLVHLLHQQGHESVAEAADWEQALQLAREQEPELVLLEMAMPGHGGRWIADKLREMQLQTRVVFIIDPAEYALQAEESIDYLLKPVQRVALENFLLPSGNTNSTNHPAGNVPGIERLGIKDIWFFRSDGNLVLAFDGRDDYPIDMSLKQIQQHYDQRFVRIHRDYLVDCHRIERLERDKLGSMHLWLKGYARSLPVSQRQEARVRAAMNC